MSRTQEEAKIVLERYKQIIQTVLNNDYLLDAAVNEQYLYHSGGK